MTPAPTTATFTFASYGEPAGTPQLTRRGDRCTRSDRAAGADARGRAADAARRRGDGAAAPRLRRHVPRLARTRGRDRRRAHDLATTELRSVPIGSNPTSTTSPTPNGPSS